MLKAVSRECGSAGFLLARADVNSHVKSLLLCSAYAWGTNGLMGGNIAGHLAAVMLFTPPKSVDLNCFSATRG